MSAAPATIRRRTKTERAAGFERLRAQGLELVQKTSGSHWTDHNLHDPGITILEQLCYALTELAYRAGFAVADHLTDSDGAIHYEALSLHPPHQAFPCRATTAADYRRLLLDRVSGLDDAGFLPDDAGTAPAGTGHGVRRLMVKLAAGPRRLPDDRVKLALAAYRSERGLGEDVDDDVKVIGDQRCELHAEIEISGPRDAADVLAEVFHRAARYIDRGARLRSRRDLLDRGLALEAIYDGPVTELGFADAAAPNTEAAELLYFSDVVRELVGVDGGVDGIKEVRRLWLRTPDGDSATGSLVWRDATRMLRLHIPGHPEEPADDTLRHVQVRRRAHLVDVDAQDLWRRVQDLQAAERAQRDRQSTIRQQDEQHDLPRGEHRGSPPYHSVQHHFPAVYQLGRHGLPRHAPAQQVAPARQLRSYLLLFEQVIANGQAQLQNLHALFALPGAAHQTYWWQPLGAGQVPGLDGICMLTPAALEREVFAPLDYSTPRKSRLLDHLLALHGETYTQNALRQFCTHLRAEELDEQLLANKAAYLKDIVELSRHRAGGFDYSQPLWDKPGNFSGLARRACVLLGFRYSHARPLTHRLLRVRSLFSEADPQGAEPLTEAEVHDAEAVAIGASPLPAPAREAHLQALLRRAGAPLSAALLRCGASSEKYRVVSAAAHDGGGSLRMAVAVGPDERQRWWRLGDFETDADARAAAHVLRDYLLRLNSESEGLHLVEHVLLRPLQADPAPAAGPRPQASFFALRLTAVLPNWTVRSHQQGFRALAEETLRINCPPHLALQVLWLGFEEMVLFESAYRQWLDARRAHCASSSDKAAQAADKAAAGVIAWLLPRATAAVDFSSLAGSHG